MKRIIFILALVAAFAFESKAQKFALIDMEYILKNIPAYERASERTTETSISTVGKRDNDSSAKSREYV